MTEWRSGDRVPDWSSTDDGYLGRSTGQRRERGDDTRHECHNCGQPFPYEPIRLDSEPRRTFCTLACRDNWMVPHDASGRSVAPVAGNVLPTRPAGPWSGNGDAR